MLDCQAAAPAWGAVREEVRIPGEVLDSLGWTNIIVREGFDPAVLGTVLGELALEGCAHSWLGFAAGGPRAAEALIAWEQNRRPSVMFAYHGVDAAGAQDLVGVGLVSERIAADFGARGFPVIARCFIRRRYRGRHLYAALLDHRYRYCQARWGSALKAVHLGTASPAVHAAALDGALLHPPFRRVATEGLHVDGHVTPVGVYLAFQPGYAAELLAAADPEPRRINGALVAELRHLRGLLSALVAGEADLFEIRREIHALRARHDWVEGEALAALLAFSEHITPHVAPR